MTWKIIKYSLLLYLTVFFHAFTFAQETIKGLVADSITGQGLPFSSIHIDNRSGYISNIHGGFSITIDAAYTNISFSYTGYNTKTIAISKLKSNDTIFLSRKRALLHEVIISSNNNKIRKIINNAVLNKPMHNPDNYKSYTCNMYYKMNISVINFPQDTFHYKNNKTNKIDSVNEPLPDFFTDKSYLMLSETYSKRIYKKPQKLQEIVLASRFSGLKKTYFTNTITDILPFHIYDNYIKLNNEDYLNPIASGWQNNYKFILEDQMNLPQDTIYLLSFEPKKNKYFNSLTGTVYINKNGYAISHITGSTSDTTKDRTISFEQVYTLDHTKWFPKELNYTFTIKKMLSPNTVIKVNGHSIVDSVNFDIPTQPMNNAHPIILADSIDLISNKEWERFRFDSLSSKEKNTYKVLDSFSEKNHIERIIRFASKLSLNKISLGKLDVDIDRIIRSNEFEGLRLGSGFYTNNEISKFYSIGGWLAYGFKDRKWKGGTSVTYFPNGNKDNWLQLYIYHDYKKAGDVFIFEDPYKKQGLNWVLRQPDEVSEYRLSGQLQNGFAQINPQVKKITLTTSPFNIFKVEGNAYRSFISREINLGLRYAYGEKRIPVFDYYIPQETKFPVLYARIGLGDIKSDRYQANYIKAVTALTYSHHTNRLGHDRIKIDAGWVKELKTKVIPRSFLFATNGVRINTVTYFFEDGFLTMRPNEYFTDKFINLFYKHDFDKFFWQLFWSKPFLSASHNIAYGNIASASRKANPGIETFTHGYHESGFLINHLLKYNVHLADLNLNTGIFYHWKGKPDLKTNTTIAFSLGISF